nr:MAG TPA: hypothetical protein [Caudoviricetes sp.]
MRTSKINIGAKVLTRKIKKVQLQVSLLSLQVM